MHTELSAETALTVKDLLEGKINWFMCYYATKHTEWSKQDVAQDSSPLPEGSIQLISGGRCLLPYLADKVQQILAKVSERLIFIFYSDNNKIKGLTLDDDCTEIALPPPFSYSMQKWQVKEAYLSCLDSLDAVATDCTHCNNLSTLMMFLDCNLRVRDFAQPNSQNISPNHPRSVSVPSYFHPQRLNNLNNNNGDSGDDDDDAKNNQPIQRGEERDQNGKLKWIHSQTISSSPRRVHLLNAKTGYDNPRNDLIKIKCEDDDEYFFISTHIAMKKNDEEGGLTSTNDFEQQSEKKHAQLQNLRKYRFVKLNATQQNDHSISKFRAKLNNNNNNNNNININNNNNNNNIINNTNSSDPLEVNNENSDIGSFTKSPAGY